MKRLLIVGALTVAAAPSAFAAGRPQAIHWGHRAYSSRAPLASWLSAHGASYPIWARRHPVGAAIVEHRPLPPKPPRTAPQAPPRPKPPAHEMPAPRQPSGSRISVASVRYVLLVLAALVMLAAAAPAALVRPGGRGAWLSTTRRTYVFALGLSVCVGVLIAGAHL
jgi:uncharacterized protein YfaQ (DUF2300 family)